MENGLIMVICLFGLGILCAIAMGIGAIIAEIQDRIAKKRRAKLIKEYPELKELLAEYMRTQNNVGYTASKIHLLKEEINKQMEENKYLPKGDRVDAYIETLKEKYKTDRLAGDELTDIFSVELIFVGLRIGGGDQINLIGQQPAIFFTVRVE